MAKNAKVGSIFIRCLNYFFVLPRYYDQTSAILSNIEKNLELVITCRNNMSSKFNVGTFFATHISRDLLVCIRTA